MRNRVQKSIVRQIKTCFLAVPQIFLRLLAFLGVKAATLQCTARTPERYTPRSVRNGYSGFFFWAFFNPPCRSSER